MNSNLTQTEAELYAWECAESCRGWALRAEEDRRTLRDQDWERRREVAHLRLALRLILDTASWYAKNGDRLPLEVDHALCVEVVDFAERGLEGLSLPSGASGTDAS